MQTVRVVNRILHSSSIRTSLFLINPEERNVFSKNNICRNYAGADVFYAFLMTQKLPDAAPMLYYNENSSNSSFSFTAHAQNTFDQTCSLNGCLIFSCVCIIIFLARTGTMMGLY